MNLGKQVHQSRVEVLDDFSQGEDVNVAIKRRVVKGEKKMGIKSSGRKTVSRKQTVKESRLTTSKKKRVLVDLL